MNGMNKAIVGVVFGIALIYSALSLLLTVPCGKPLFWKGRLWRPFPSVVPATGGLGFCPGCV